MTAEIAVILGSILVAGHYFGKQIRITKRKADTLSFAAGLSIAYIFLHVMTEPIAEIHSRGLFVSMLIGFAIFHLIEKHTYKHRSSRRKYELRNAHSAALFTYHFIVGMVLVSLTSSGITTGLLFFVPIFLYSTVSSISLSELHESVKEKPSIRAMISLAPLIGVLAGVYIAASGAIYGTLLGFVAGSLLYIVVRDELPAARRGSAAYFLLGVIVYTLVLIAAATV